MTTTTSSSSTNSLTAASSSIASIVIAPEAYTKIILHSARYPYACISGFLFGPTPSSSSSASSPLSISVSDVLPLTHNPLVGPLLDVATAQARHLVAQSSPQHRILGIYFASDNVDRRDANATIQRLMSLRLHAPWTVLILDNARLAAALAAPSAASSAITSVHPFEALLQPQNADKWSSIPAASIRVTSGEAARVRVRAMIVKGQEHSLNDFEDHIEDVACDWTNKFITVEN